MNTIDDIKNDKIHAYNRVITVSEVLLTAGYPRAFEEILLAFEEYELRVKEEESLLKKQMPGQAGMTMIFTSKNIKDVYWALPASTKALWDAVPELQSWRDQYR